MKKMLWEELAAKARLEGVSMLGVVESFDDFAVRLKRLGQRKLARTIIFKLV